MDKARLHHIVHSKTKAQLQDMVTELANLAYGLASEVADLDEAGEYLPADEQSDADIAAIIKITGV